ncbi:MAG: hypothetical protein ACYS18_12135, partial [Planctomycetota bacterium]
MKTLLKSPSSLSLLCHIKWSLFKQMHAKLKLSPLESRRIDGWRALYQRSATKQSWEKAHRWPYSEEVAQRTIDDIRKKLSVDSAQRILEVGCGCGVICQKLLTDNQKGVGL